MWWELGYTKNERGDGGGIDLNFSEEKTHGRYTYNIEKSFSLLSYNI